MMLQTLTGAVGGFVAGYTTKTLLIKFTHREQVSKEMISEIVVLIVSFAWLASILVLLNNPVFQIPFAVHALMGAVVGWLFKIENPLLGLVSRKTETTQSTMEKAK